MGLTGLGIFHTIIGVGAIVAAIVSFIRFGKIDLKHSTGKIYFYFTLITSLTALGISKMGGFNPGHILSLLIILLIGTAYLLAHRKPGNNRARYFENFLLSFSFFLSMIPTVNETLTRIPVGNPIAKDITDPLIGKTLFVILILFMGGSVYQVFKQRKVNRG